MQTKALKSDVMLFTAALIWGSAFVAQKKGMDYIGPMTFTGLRFLLGALVLVPVLLYQTATKAPQKSTTSFLLKTAPLAGIALFAGAVLQQIGLVTTTASKTGFITGLYIAIVPLISLIIRQKVPMTTWIGFVVAFAGMFLLTFDKNMNFVSGDLFVLAGALFWAIHTHLISHLAPKTNPWRLAFVQFVTCGILSLITALFVEDISMPSINDAGIAIFYGGVMSVGIAFTLQALSQQTAPATHAAIIMSLEMPFAAIAGYFFLEEVLSTRDLAGCILMLIGVLAVQMANILKKHKKIPSHV